MAGKLILAVKNLTKKYDDITAVNDVSFSVGAGEVVGLLGPNGAGKTTIINMVLNILEPTAGRIEILGQNLAGSPKNLMSQVNFAAVYASVPGNMTVWENLYIFGLLYGVKNLKTKIPALLAEFELTSLAKTRVGVLSSGEQTRVSVAKALINSPKLLLLDEPTASLDPSTAYIIRDKLKKYAAENQNSILWTSHNMHEVEAVCDRVLFISQGKILLSGKPAELPKKHGKKNLEELFITVAREPLTLELG